MHLGDLIIFILGGCFVIAFLIEIVINRRPGLVALAVSLGGFASLIMVDWQGFWQELWVVGGIYAALGTLFAIAALVGSGLARFIRLSFELFWDTAPTEKGNGR